MDNLIQSFVSLREIILITHGLIHLPQPIPLSLNHVLLPVLKEMTEEKLSVILLATLVHGSLKEPAKYKGKNSKLPQLDLNIQLVSKELMVTLTSVDGER
jgi:hypothetical protein